MICEFQKQHELDYADRKKAMDEKNVSTALDNTADDIQETRDDNGGDDARALQEMVVLNIGLGKETRGSSSLCLRPMNPSMDVDPSSVNGETELNAYMRVKQVAKDTDPLMLRKQHQQEVPRLARMTRQYLAVPASSSSPERLFSSVGLVKSDLRGSFLDNTLIDVMWAKQAP
jgi:hypothetical protein